MAKRNSRRDNPHAQIHYVLDRCKPTRKDIAEQLGISRQTLADWEYQRTKVRDHMLTDIQRVTGFDLSTIPAQLVQRDLDAVLNPAKKKAEPPPPKTNYGEEAKAEEERQARLKAKQAAKATDPKRHRIRNYGYPTAANQNPATFARVCPSHLVKWRKEGLDIPSDAEYPDMVAAALKGMAHYEIIYVERHPVPECLNPGGVCNAASSFYWTRPNGQPRTGADTIDQAKALIATQMAEDEAALLKDLI